MEAKGRLVLTLCKSDAQESYRHVIIPLPRSYETAVIDAKRVFQPYLGNLRLQASDIVLKCAIKRANGTGAWAIIHPADWSSVIHPDGDEVGVFIRQDSLNLPYEPMRSSATEAGASMQKFKKPIVQQPQHNNAHTSRIQVEKRIMYLTLSKGDLVTGDEKSMMIEVPSTYQECQAEAYKAFAHDLRSGAKQSDVILQSKRGELRGYGSLGKSSWSVVTPAAYNLLISTTSGNCIELWVGGPLKPAYSHWD